MAGIQTPGKGSLRSAHPTMIFTNKPNPLINGHYKSRSVAVVVLPMFHCNGALWVPLGKRSEAMKDNAGLECLPCGYVDWDETVDVCAIRETWEEIGLDVSPMLLGVQAYSYNSDPAKDAKQNITFRFRCFQAVDKLPELYPSEEVESARWVKVSGAIKLPLAFGHDRLIAGCLEWADSQIRLQPLLKRLNGEFVMPKAGSPDWHMRNRI